MPQLITIGPRNINVRGPVFSSAVEDLSTAIASGYTSYGISMDLSPWPPNENVTLAIEFSPDGGATWGWGNSNTWPGGTVSFGLGGAAPSWPGLSGALPRSDSPAAVGNGWPETPPASTLARATATVSSNHVTQYRIVLG